MSIKSFAVAAFTAVVIALGAAPSTAQASPETPATETAGSARTIVHPDATRCGCRRYVRYRIVRPYVRYYRVHYRYVRYYRIRYI
jgi:hypothetical protein